MLNNAMRIPRNKRVMIKILTVVAGLSFIPVVIAAPNAIQILRIFKFKNDQWQQFLRSYSNMLRNDYFEARSTKNGVRLSLSKKGRLVLESGLVENIVLKRKKIWDGKWRVVTFDIPNRLTNKRIMFKNRLIKMGMKQIQKSVYVFPDECRAAVESSAEYFKLSRFVMYGELSKLNPEQHLLDYFEILI